MYYKTKKSTKLVDFFVFKVIVVVVSNNFIYVVFKFNLKSG